MTFLISTIRNFNNSNKIKKNSDILIYSSLFFIGGLTTFSLPPFSILPFFLFLGLGIYLIDNIDTLKKTFFAGWFFGFGWFLFGLHWIGSAFLVSNTYQIFLMPLAVIVLPGLLALFWALAFFLAKLIGKKIRSSILLSIVFLALLEYVRSNIFTGFPWLMPSMILTSNDYLIQIFSFVGSYAANLVVIVSSVLPFILYYKRRFKYSVFFMLCIPIVLLFYNAFFRFHFKDDLKFNSDQLITIVQPNIKQKDKWELIKRESHIKKLVKLSKYNSEEYKNINRLIIWPETSFAGVVPREIKLLSKTTKDIASNNKKVSLIIGLLSLKNQKVFNSLILLNSSGNIDYKYDKIHLVPFGEYIPFRKHFKYVAEWISKIDFATGLNKDNISIDGIGGILPLICYEVLFAEEVKNRVSNTTKLIINITNDGWFGNTIGPYQHLALAKIRAVELGIPLVRVANTGISAFISPYGDEIIKIPINKEDVQTTKLVLALDNTIYKKFGDYIFSISILFILFINALTNSRKILKY